LSRGQRQKEPSEGFDLRSAETYVSSP